MKAFEITEAGKEALLSRKFQMVRVNYANPDMVRCPNAALVFGFVTKLWGIAVHIGAPVPLMHMCASAHIATSLPGAFACQLDYTV